MGLLYSLGNVFISPFGRLYFRDFYIADFITSMPTVLIDIAYSVCFFSSGQFLARDTVGFTYSGNCNQYNTLYFGSIFLFFPYWFRFAQCLNKYYYTGNAFPHLVNAGKYFSGLVTNSFTVLHSLADPLSKVEIFTGINIALIFIHLINAIYCWLWDVYMDWGLARSEKRPLLRDKLLCKRVFVYYAIIAGDIILRLFWVLSLMNYLWMPSTYWGIISSIVEVLRRGVWGWFRVELEALENYEEYRTIDIKAPRLVPKPNKNKSNSSNYLPESDNSGKFLDSSKLEFLNKTKSQSQNFLLEV